MSFTEYPEYKDSGVEWLGEVPRHWIVTNLKRGYSVTLGKMLQPELSDSSDELLPYLRAANIQWSNVDLSDVKLMWISTRERKQLRLEHGDLLVSEGGDVGRSCLWISELSECYFQNSINRVRSKNSNSNKYLYYWISTIKDKGYIDVLCNKSTIAHFTAEKVEAVTVPFPSSEEQIAIAKFLDHETAKIDALVAEQQNLIELLKEKRQAVISHVVTKGLNLKVKMKYSGVERLGDIPDHWEIKPIQWVASINDEVLPESTDDDYEIEYVDIGSVNLTSGIESSEIHKFKDAPSRARRIVKNGDVIVSTVRTYLKAIAFVKEPPENMIVSTGFAVIRSKSGLESNFAKFGLQSTNFIDEVISRSTGISYPAINASELAKIKIPLPTVEEQKIICEYLNKQTLEIDTLISESQKIIVLSQERRSAVISAAVTGQIDVRNYQPKEVA